MSGLAKRIEALENKGAGGLVLLLISRLPGREREMARYDGMTYTQEPGETPEQFRNRLAECLKDRKTHFIWVSELDAAL
jgi:hypothetical protein